jgi:hypothetical protein
MSHVLAMGAAAQSLLRVGRFQYIGTRKFQKRHFPVTTTPSTYSGNLGNAMGRSSMLIEKRDACSAADEVAFLTSIIGGLEKG